MTYYQAQRRIGSLGIYWTDLTTDIEDDAVSRCRTIHVQTGADTRVITYTGKIVYRVRSGGSGRRLESKLHSVSRGGVDLVPVKNPETDVEYYYDNGVFVSRVFYIHPLAREGWFRGRQVTQYESVEKNLLEANLRMERPVEEAEIEKLMEGL